MPGMRASIVNQVVLQHHGSYGIAVGVDEGYAFLDIEGVVVHLCHRTTGRQQDGPAIILADIVTENGVHRLLTADHQAAALIVVAVVVLVDCAVTPVGVKSLAVLVFAIVVTGVEHFIELEQCILAFPRPDGGCHPTEVAFGVVLFVDLAASSIGNVVLDERAVAVHGGDGIAAGIFDKVAADDYAAGTVPRNYIVGDLFGKKMAAICGVGHRDAPPIHVFQIATLNAHVVKPGNSGFRLVCWHEGSEVDATVAHMLVVHIAVHMTHCKIAQVNMAKGMIWGTAGNILRGAFAPVFSRIASRIGWKTCLSNIFVLYALLALLLFFSGPQNGFWIAPIYLVLSTLPMSGISVGTLQLRVATSDAEMRSVYFSAYSLISGVASLVGTSICSALIEVLDKNTAGLPLQSLYLLGLLLLVFPFVLFRNLPKDVR